MPKGSARKAQSTLSVSCSWMLPLVKLSLMSRATIVQAPECTVSPIYCPPKNAATDVTNMLFDYMTGLLGGEYLQARFDKLLNDAEHLCPVSPKYELGYLSPVYAPFQSPQQESSLRLLILLGISTGIIVFSVLFVMTCVKCIVLRRHRRWIRTLQGRKVQAILQLQIQESTKEAAHYSEALWFHGPFVGACQSSFWEMSDSLCRGIFPLEPL